MGSEEWTWTFSGHSNSRGCWSMHVGKVESKENSSKLFSRCFGFFFLIKNYVIKNLFAIPNHLNGRRDEWRGGSFLVE
jgi:hypothetical protein